jgi:hypothetical protein
MDCVTGTRFFELRFEVEPFVPSGKVVKHGPKEGMGEMVMENVMGIQGWKMPTKRLHSWTSLHQKKISNQKIQQQVSNMMLMVLWKILMMMTFWMMLGRCWLATKEWGRWMTQASCLWRSW